MSRVREAPQMSYRAAMRAAGAEYLRAVLASSSSVTEAARRAGVNRQNLYRTCARVGVVIPIGNRGPQRARCAAVSRVEEVR